MHRHLLVGKASEKGGLTREKEKILYQPVTEKRKGINYFEQYRGTNVKIIAIFLLFASAKWAGASQWGGHTEGRPMPKVKHHSN